MRIALVSKYGQLDTGIGRYTTELAARLADFGYEVMIVHPALPLPKWSVRLVRRLLNWDLEDFFSSYPVWIRSPDADIYHFSGQNLATLLLMRRPPGKVVITVHDIIPWTTRRDPKLRVYSHAAEALFDRLAMWAIKRADAVVSDSEYTARHLHDEKLVNPAAITATIGLGVG